jgi:hypothetical protein
VILREPARVVAGVAEDFGKYSGQVEEKVERCVTGSVDNAAVVVWPCAAGRLDALDS